MVVFEQVFILFVFILAGFALSKFGIVDKSHSSLLSKLLVYVFSACLMFKSFATNFNIENLTQQYRYIVAGGSHTDRTGCGRHGDCASAHEE